MFPFKSTICSILLFGWLSNPMPTDEAPPTITAPVSPHDLNRALKRDAITYNNDICYSPATCFGPVDNIAACCEPGEDCSLITTCYPYTEIQSYSSLDLGSNMSTDAGGAYCISEYPYCITYIFGAYSGLEVIYCDDTSTANNQVILTGVYDWTDLLRTTTQIPAPLTATDYKTVVSFINVLPPQTSGAASTSTSIASPPSTFPPTPTATSIATHRALPTSAVIGIAVGATLLGVAIIVIGILLWRRHSSTTNMPPRPPSNAEIQIASYASPVSPLTNPHTSLVPAAIVREKPPSYGYEARNIGIQPDCQAEGVGEGVHAPPAWAPPGDVIGKQAQPAFISELGGESRGEGAMVGSN